MTSGHRPEVSVAAVVTCGQMAFLSYFFVKKIPLSRRVGYVMDGWISGSVDRWFNGSVDQWISGSVDQ